MKVNIIGRQTRVPEEMKAICEKKLAKFDKFFKDDAVAYVTLSTKRNKDNLELTISSNGTLFRSEKENTTYNNALDDAIESIERQIRKNKTRLEKRLREGAFLKDLGEASVDEEQEFDVRVKTFDLKPMTTEEAILQMNLLGHEFFVFINTDTGETNVVYKRKDRGYGVIVPAAR